MSVNTQEHILIPKHELLSEEEIKELLARFKITKNDLPKIKKNDPALKKLKVKIDDVIKITRISPTAGETVYYRVVKK